MGIAVDVMEFSLAASVWSEWVTQLWSTYSGLPTELCAACESNSRRCPTAILSEPRLTFPALTELTPLPDVAIPNLRVIHLWTDVKCSLEPAIQNQEPVNTFVGWFNDGSHDVKSAFAALFTAAQHTGIFYADSLEKKNIWEQLWAFGSCKNCKSTL